MTHLIDENGGPVVGNHARKPTLFLHYQCYGNWWREHPNEPHGFAMITTVDVETGLTEIPCKSCGKPIRTQLYQESPESVHFL